MLKPLMFLSFSVILPGCLRTQTLHQERTENPAPIETSGIDSAFLALPPREPVDGTTLIVKGANISSVPLGENASARIIAQADDRADYIHYEVFDAKSPKPLRTGKFAVADELLHNLPAGTLKIILRACVEDSHGLANKEPCGKPYELSYLQKGNPDTKLAQLLEARESLITAQKEYSEKILAAVDTYKNSGQTQTESQEDQEFENLLNNMQLSGPTKLGDVIANSPALEDAHNKLEEKEKSKAKKKAHDKKTEQQNDYIASGAVLVFLGSIVVIKFDSLFENKAAEQLKDAHLKFEEIRGATTTLDKLDQKSENYTSEKIKLKAARDVAIEDGKKLSEWEATPLNSPLKHYATAAALVAGGYLIYSELDEGLFQLVDKVYKIMSFGLAFDPTSPRSILMEELGRQEQELLKLKSEVTAWDSKILAHLETK